MKIEFVKMQGCGNDYIYVNCLKYDMDSPGMLSIKLSDRRYGIGGDGLILICKSEKADAQMRIFNTDGSEGKMCGNGIRCVGKFLYDSGIVASKHIKIDTLSGIKYLELCNSSGKVSTLRVNMGNPEFKPMHVPVNLEGEKIISRDVIINEKQYNINCVSMGNPHCVIFCDDPNMVDLKSVGTEIQESGLFPQGVNVEIAHVDTNKNISLRVWERGSGETLACGTGACAVVVAAVENGLCPKGEDIKVKLRGGDLVIKYDNDNQIYMTGPAEEVFKGEIEI